MKTGQPPATVLFSDRASGGTMRHDERGLIGIVGIAIMGIIALFGFSAAAAIDWSFIIALVVMVTIALSVFGSVVLHFPFKYTIIVVVCCLAMVVFLEIGALAAAGLIVIGGIIFKLSPAKQPGMFMVLIGVGCLMVIWGAKFCVESLGILP